MDDPYNLLAWIERFEHLFTDSLLGDVLHEIPHDFKTHIRFQQRPFDELRSAQQPAAATLYGHEDGHSNDGHEGGAEVALEIPQVSIAPGQACVFYDGDRVLGGGWIAREEGAAAAA